MDNIERKIQAETERIKFYVDMAIKNSREEFLAAIEDKLQTFRVINGQAPKCCRDAFREGEEVGNDKLRKLKEEFKKGSMATPTAYDLIDDALK